MKSCLFASVAAVVLAATAAAGAAEVAVHQAGNEFAPGEVTIRPGDTVRFVNDDKATHTVYSRDPGGAFDLGAMHPGAEATQGFGEVGAYTVHCAIHPRMTMTVVVTK